MYEILKWVLIGLVLVLLLLLIYLITGDLDVPTQNESRKFTP